MKNTIPRPQLMVEGFLIVLYLVEWTLHFYTLYRRLEHSGIPPLIGTFNWSAGPLAIIRAMPGSANLSLLLVLVSSSLCLQLGIVFSMSSRTKAGLVWQQQKVACACAIVCPPLAPVLWWALVRLLLAPGGLGATRGGLDSTSAASMQFIPPVSIRHQDIVEEQDGQTTVTGEAADPAGELRARSSKASCTLSGLRCLYGSYEAMFLIYLMTIPSILLATIYFPAVAAGQNSQESHPWYPSHEATWDPYLDRAFIKG